MHAPGSSAEDKNRITRQSEASDLEDPRAATSGGRFERLSPDEERFVTAFVEYWLRRGAMLTGETE